MYAHCHRSGEIELSRRINLPGQVLIASGLKADLERKLAGRARLAYDNKIWLVPGLPEADTDDKAFDATKVFKTRMARTL